MEEPLREGKQEKRVSERSPGQLCQRLLRCRIRQQCEMDIRFGSVPVMAPGARAAWRRVEAEPVGEAPTPRSPVGAGVVGLRSGQG